LPTSAKKKWIKGKLHPNFLFRVAVHEVEAWLLADRQAFAKFAHIRANDIPTDVDAIPNTKEFLISLVRKSRKRTIKENIVPKTGSTAKIGPNYNGRLCQYVMDYWDMNEAQKYSPSLKKTIEKIRTFTPLWM